MNNLSLAVDVIKNSVSAIDVAQAIGLNVDMHGRCSCPFHNGKDRNMKLFDGNRGYSCFVCHASGDVISFVRQYYSIGFKDALVWLDGTFRLGLDLDGQIDADKQRQAEMALQRRKRARELAEWKKRMQFGLALTAMDLVRRCEEVRDEKRPRTYGEWDPGFCEAVVTLPDARQFADDMMMECMEVKE